MFWKIDARIVKILWKVEGIINALKQMYKNNYKKKSGIYNYTTRLNEDDSSCTGKD